MEKSNDENKVSVLLDFNGEQNVYTGDSVFVVVCSHETAGVGLSGKMQGDFSNDAIAGIIGALRQSAGDKRFMDAIMNDALRRALGKDGQP